LLKNDYSLPLGFGYNKFIKKSEFDKLNNVFSKSAMLLAAYVVEDKEYRFAQERGFTELHLTNIGFMGVYINKGNHEIELVFEPEYFTVGFIVLGVSYLLLIFLFIFRNKINLFSNKF